LTWLLSMESSSGTGPAAAIFSKMRCQTIAVVISAPPANHRLFWAWFAFGFPAFAAVLGILWLMITRPAFHLFL
jgi:uncharacterized membrane protein